MKYIKTYEMFKSDLKIGDYVLLDIDQIKKNCIEYEQDFNNYNLIDNKCKIIKIGDIIEMIEIEFYYGLNPDMTYVLPNEIKRKLTSEEIEDYEIQIERNKYNL